MPLIELSHRLGHPVDWVIWSMFITVHGSSTNLDDVLRLSFTPGLHLYTWFTPDLHLVYTFAPGLHDLDGVLRLHRQFHRLSHFIE
jgi:hypothetical protein